MKLKIKLVFITLLCSFSSVLNAQSVDINMAKAIAEHHMANVSQPALKSKSLSGTSFQFTSVKATVENKDTLYYVLNDTINKGFVIVSADMRAWPILGYSTAGCFDEKNQPEAFTAWMNIRKKEIEYIKKNNLQADSAIKEKWQNMNLKSSAIETSSVEPLIKTQWDQGCYYNSMCPADPTSGFCGRVPVGCTVTAMAQIMKYWNFPTKGIGSHSYDHPTYGNLSADFGSTTYQWSQMPNQVTSQNDAVATLMYHCGVSLEMDYGPSSSGAWDPRDEMVKYFNYSSNAMLVNRKAFTTDDWAHLLKAELDLGRPIWYMGGSSVSHAFICDGYQDSNFFHFNWGWGGSSDGYFYIGDMSPSWYNFNENQSALLNLVPGNLPDGYNGFFLSSNTLDIATKGGTSSVDICSSVNWTATCDQTWLSLSKNTGPSGKTTLTIVSSENQSGSDRSAIITILADGFDFQTIAVNQLAKINVTAGGLSDLMANKGYRSRITQLTLTGFIDARDFKTMRDAMPSLTDVDLSDVNIVTYTGNGGTSDGTKTYPPNEIPILAFSIVSCQGQNFLKTIILPNSVTSIGVFAFQHCKYLTSIDISEKVTEIPYLAFNDCSALINVDIENPNYSSIDGVLFNKEKTTIIKCPVSKTGNYTIPNSVITIGSFAFSECIKLTNVTIPLSVRFIKDYAFKQAGLTTLFIPSSVTSIINSTFLGGSALISVDVDNPNYSSKDGVLYDKLQTELIHCPIQKKGIFTVPNSVTTIGHNAFSYCSSLTSIIIPSSVTYIGSSVFNSCKGLTNVTIPSSITSISYGTFNYCVMLSKVIIPASVNSIEASAFSACFSLDSICVYAQSPPNIGLMANVFSSVDKTRCTLYVPYGTKAAYQKANEWNDFQNIVEMSGIFLSSNHIDISPNTGEASITISSSSSWTATSDQTWLTINPTKGITGSDSITIFASEIPKNEKRTATVTISATGIDSQTITVTQYGMVQFMAENLNAITTEQLSTITSLTLIGTIDARDFKTMRDEMPALTDIDLSSATIVAYSGPDGPGGESVNYYLANGIPPYAFMLPYTQQGKTRLESIILPESVNLIGNWSFKNCVGLTNINLSQKVTSIGYEAFSNCTGIVSINLPLSLKDIGSSAFLGCSNLSSVTIPSSIVSIKDGAFSGCSRLKSISVKKKLPPSLDYPINSMRVFNMVDKTACTLYVPFGSKSLYASAIQWKDFVNIVEMANQSPVANAGIDQTVIEGKTVTLDGSASYDSDNDSLSYSWTAPVGISLSSTTSVSPTFTAPEVLSDTVLVFSLVVNDGIVDSPADEVKITVKNINKAPLANAGRDQTVKEGEIVTLDGSASYGSNGKLLTYKWTVPTGITLSSTSAQKPTFTAPEVADQTILSFLLVVNDDQYSSQPDTVIITVEKKTGIDKKDMISFKQMYIYPNPTTGLLVISMEDYLEQVHLVEVFNSIGQLVLATRPTAYAKSVEIDLSEFQKGLYTLKVNVGSQHYRQKIIKK